MEDIIQFAIWDFESFIDGNFYENKPEDIFKLYRSHVKCLARRRRQLNNPVTIYTGKPLRPSTIASYKWQIAFMEPKVKGLKLAIKAMIRFGILGSKKRKKAVSLKKKVVSLEDYRWNREYEALQQKKESGEFDIEGVLNDLLKE